MHFFHTFGSTKDELTISIGQSVGNAENAVAYARNAKETEFTEESSGSQTKFSVTRIGCVKQIQGKKRVAERLISQLQRKRRNIQVKKKNAFPTRFKKKNYGRKIKKGGNCS